MARQGIALSYPWPSFRYSTSGQDCKYDSWSESAVMGPPVPCSWWIKDLATSTWSTVNLGQRYLHYWPDTAANCGRASRSQYTPKRATPGKEQLLYHADSSSSLPQPPIPAQTMVSPSCEKDPTSSQRVSKRSATRRDAASHASCELSGALTG